MSMQSPTDAEAFYSFSGNADPERAGERCRYRHSCDHVAGRARCLRRMRGDSVRRDGRRRGRATDRLIEDVRTPSSDDGIDAVSVRDQCLS